MFAFFGGGGSGGMANPMSHANSLILGGAGGNPLELQSAAGRIVMSDPVSGAVNFVDGGKKRIFHSVLAANALSFSIPSIPAGWSRLIIELVGRSDAGGSNVNQLRFNGDTGANYSADWTENGSAGSLINTTFARIGATTGPTGAPSIGGFVRIEIPLYDGATWWKSGLFEYPFFNTTNNFVIGSGVFQWASTSPITSAVILAGGNNYLAGTVCNAYVEM